MNSFHEAEQYLLSLVSGMKKTFSGQKGLDRMKVLLAKLGNPEQKLNVIHIAGTAGKSSTAYYIDALLRKAGKTTGLHVSPHVVDIRERMHVNGELLSGEEFVLYVSKIKDIVDGLQKDVDAEDVPTYFEVIVALALMIFVDKGVDYAVIETGLGGRYDGTNVFDDQVCVFTPIGLDHMKILGDTIEEIAGDKSHIIHPGNVVISAPQDPSAVQVLEQRYVLVNGAVDDNFKVLDYPVSDFSAANLKLAQTVVRHLGLPINDIDVYIPGRYTKKNVHGRCTIFDGAHNEMKMQALCSRLQKEFPDEQFTFVFAVKQGKAVKKMLHSIVPIAHQIIITQFIVGQDLEHSSEPSSAVCSILDELGFSNYSIVDDPQKAYAQAHDPRHTIVVTGSLYLLDAFSEYLRTQLDV